jgi:hypothetical protein
LENFFLLTKRFLSESKRICLSSATEFFNCSRSSIDSLMNFWASVSDLLIQNPKSKIENLIMYPKGNLFIPASHGQFEAILKEPAGEPKGVALVCHPHPLGGGTMHNKVVYRAAPDCRSRFVTLRFNFRGVGASTGAHDDGDRRKTGRARRARLFNENYPNQPITRSPDFPSARESGTEVG